MQIFEKEDYNFSSITTRKKINSQDALLSNICADYRDRLFAEGMQSQKTNTVYTPQLAHTVDAHRTLCGEAAVSYLHCGCELQE